MSGVPQVTVNNWFQKIDGDERILARELAGGSKTLYPVLARQISIINEHLREGATLAARVGGQVSAAISQRITGLREQLLSPAENLVRAHPDEFGQESVQGRDSDAAIEKKWLDLGLPKEVLETDADCARFLLKTKLAYAIVGFKEAAMNPEAQETIRFDADGHPQLKVDGNWTRWEILRDYFEYDEKQGKVISRRNDHELVWTYISPRGFTRADRFEYPNAYPVHQLSQEEYRIVRAQAAKFYETHPELDAGTEKDCIVQFFTSPRWYLYPEMPIFENGKNELPIHIGVRLITADRHVYSFGFEMTPEQAEHILPGKAMISTSLATTADTRIAMADYEEFREHHGRITTSIPTTSARAQKILEKISAFNQNQIRFNFKEQNCTALVGEVFQETGYQMPEVRTTLTGIIARSFPTVEQVADAIGKNVPLIGPALKSMILKVKEALTSAWQWIVNMTPNWIKKAIDFIVTVITYIPRKIVTIFENCVALAVGGAKMSGPLEKGRTEDELGTETPTIKSFSTIIRNWTDIFKDSTAVAYHSGPFIQWQKEQPSTVTNPYSGKPRMDLYPRELPKKKEEAANN